MKIKYFKKEKKTHLFEFTRTMFRFVAFIALFATISAFMNVNSRISRSSMLQMNDFKGEIGAQPPLGFWDPLGLLTDVDQERFDRLRTVENKHGRIAMLAIAGHIYTAAGNRCPGNIAFGVPFADMKGGLAAFTTIPAAGLVQLFIFIGILETGFAYAEEDIKEYCAATYPSLNDRRRQSVELNNGRAAQMGILGLMVHEKLNNDPYVLNSLLGLPHLTF